MCRQIVICLCGFVLAASAIAETSDCLSLGVVSDLHITTSPLSAECFEETLRYFDRRRVDGVLVCGDLTDTGFPEELELVAKTWFKVFPNGRRSDGGAVAQLFHLGDHDMGGYMQRRLSRGRKGELDGKILPNIDTAAVWERLFHEPWSPIQVKNVKGFDFVLAHHPKNTKKSKNGNAIPGLSEVLSKVGLDSAKPFFYSQHRIMRNTVCRQYDSGMDAGETTAHLSNRTNCIAFCGHGHNTATDDENIWQGAFTAIEVPSLSRCLTRPGRENSYCVGDHPERRSPPSQMKSIDGYQFRQCYVVRLQNDRLTIERRDCVHNFEELGRPWCVDVFGKRVSIEERIEMSAVPEFPAGATATVVERRGKNSRGVAMDQVVVSFPPAKGAYDYLVGTKRVYSPTGLFVPSADVGPVHCVFSAAEFAALAPEDFKIVPANSFGRCGRCLSFKR